MSRQELAERFLVAGRRRRLEAGGHRTANGRLVMGRKGLGKLAGFGVARRVEVTTKKADEARATRIVLTYDQLLANRTTDDVEVEEVQLEAKDFQPQGTVVRLSKLQYGPTKSRAETIRSELSECFEYVLGSDFSIFVNGSKLDAPRPTFAFAWPNPDLNMHELVEHSLVSEDGMPFKFRYRMRFRMPDDALEGQRRGVRVYARGRLAAAPSLLKADTNMHGFRMTDYLDGVVEADFVDQQPTDYIATDRQSLRWDSPLLSPLLAHLSDEIRTACREYQKKRDGAAPGLVKSDPFTQEEIAKCGLVGADRTLALRIASGLLGGCKGLDDPVYRNKFPEIIKGISHGNVLATISALADHDSPDMHQVVTQLIRLTKDDLGRFASIARGRIAAITALKKIVQDTDFKGKKNEGEVQRLLQGNPWMLDPAFGAVISGNQAVSTMFDRLSKELGIGRHAPASAESDERPDLVFLVGSEQLGRIIIVELKAPNVQLDSTHLDQLLAYMETTDDYLRLNSPGKKYLVHGYLIGSFATTSNAHSQRALRRRIGEAPPTSPWTVRSFMDVLTTTELAHKEFLDAVTEDGPES